MKSGNIRSVTGFYIKDIYLHINTNLLVKDVTILHIITDKVGWTHDSGFDSDPVQREHE